LPRRPAFGSARSCADADFNGRVRTWPPPRLADRPNSALHSKIVAFTRNYFRLQRLMIGESGGTAKSAVVWKAVRCNARAAFLLRGAVGNRFAVSMA
jgi:hypothetical protein